DSHPASSKTADIARWHAECGHVVIISRGRIRKVPALAGHTIGPLLSHRSLRRIRARRISQAGWEVRRLPRTGLEQTEARNAPAAHQQICCAAHIVGVTLAASKWEIVNECADKPVAARVVSVAVIVRDVVVIADVIAVVALAACGDCGTRSYSESIRD